MTTHLDTVVIGGGAMGSAAAWALASRGREVTLLEQFSPGHLNGASHGATRNFNPGYADPDYVAMLAEAVRLWGELEADGGERLLARTGVVNHGTDPRWVTCSAPCAAPGCGPTSWTPRRRPNAGAASGSTSRCCTCPTAGS